MAAWQATFHVILPTDALPPDYDRSLSRLLPRGTHWDSGSERWGTEDGDTIATSCEPPAEMSARFDLRQWRPELYEGFAAFVRAIGGRLRDAETGEELEPTAAVLMDALHRSRAARFVADPAAYFEALRTSPD